MACVQAIWTPMDFGFPGFPSNVLGTLQKAPHPFRKPASVASPGVLYETDIACIRKYVGFPVINKSSPIEFPPKANGHHISSFNQVDRAGFPVNSTSRAAKLTVCSIDLTSLTFLLLLVFCFIFFCRGGGFLSPAFFHFA